MIASRSSESTSPGFTSHSGACTVVCNGTHMRAYCRDDATVVQVTGEIDATNVDRVYDFAHRFVAVAAGLIVDLSQVDFMCARGIYALHALVSECRAAKTNCVVIGSRAVTRVLLVGDPKDMLPTANSEREALLAIAAGRQLTRTAS